MDSLLLLKNILVKNKEKLSYEEFSNKFYRTLKINGRKYVEGEYDNLLKVLYGCEDSLYHEYLNKLGRIQFLFIKENNKLMTNLIMNDDIDLVITAYDMYKKANSIVVTSVPMKSNKITVSQSKKELLIELKTLLKSINEENGIVNQAKAKFESLYGNYSDSYLSNYYDTIMEQFETKLESFLTGELNKIGTISNDLVKCSVVNASFESQEQIQKSHRTPRIFQQNRVIVRK